MIEQRAGRDSGKADGENCWILGFRETLPPPSFPWQEGTAEDEPLGCSSWVGHPAYFRITVSVYQEI